MGGIESTKLIIKFLKEETKCGERDYPIIIGLTGHVEEKFCQEGLDAGMHEVYSKPIYTNTLLKILTDTKFLSSPPMYRSKSFPAIE